MYTRLIKLVVPRIPIRLIFVVSTIWLISGCAPSLQDSLLTEIDEAEKTWQQQGIESYTIEIRFFDSIWRAESYKITVVMGEVVATSAECIPGPANIGDCEVAEYDPQDYTVPGLFAIARTEIQKSEGQFTKVTFDSSYGFPNKISYDHPDIYDEDRSWSVVSFEVSD